MIARLTVWLRNPWGRPRALVLVTGVYIAWSILPVAIAILFAFNNGRSRTAWQGFSLRWFTGATGSVFHDSALQGALEHTLILAVLCVAFSVPLGVTLALGLQRWRGRGAGTINTVMLLPLVTPELVMGVALLLLFLRIFPGIGLGTPAQAIGQITFTISYVVVMVRGRLTSIGPEYEEAAADLGAPPRDQLRRVLLPLLAPAIIASAAVAFALSLDDFVVTQYLSSNASTTTVSMLLYASARGAPTPALNAVGEAFDSELIARVDAEDYFDFQATRPTIVLTEGEARRIDWPENNLIAVRAPGAERDLVLLDGTEPNLRWRTFSETIATAADTLGVEMVITLGALIAEVSHTLPVPITGLASSEELVEELDLERSNYEGPTGIVGVVHDCCRQVGMTSASLWAAIPHYIAAVPNPKAALALLRRLEGLTGIAVDATDLEEEAPSYEDQINRAIAANPEIEELVEKIESEQEDQLESPEDLPSADSIARDFQQFLRQQGSE